MCKRLIKKYQRDYKGEPETCSQCGLPFTEEEWNQRHTDKEGEDCHVRCCPICKELKKPNGYYTKKGE